MPAMRWTGLIGLVLCAGVGKYAKDRGNDFLDCFTAQAGVGFLLPAVELHATHCLTTGAGFGGSQKWGIEGRRDVTRVYSQVGLGILPVALLPNVRSGGEFKKDGAVGLFYTYVSECSEGPMSLLGGTTGVRTAKSILLFDVTSIPKFAYHEDSSALRLSEAIYGGGVQSSFVQEERRAIEALDVHVDATLALLVGPSFRLGFSPGQFADFVLGFFGLDIAGDDAKPQPPKTKEGDKR